MTAPARVTVLQSLDGSPVNKLVTRRPDGSIAKVMAKHDGSFMAWTEDIPDVQAMAALLRRVGERPDQAISLSLFRSAPDRPFLVLSMPELARKLGVDPGDRDALAGFHKLDGEPVVARMLESMELGRWLLFDRDQADGMPEALAGLARSSWDLAVDAMFPGFAICGVVWMPSTSSRVLVDGQPLSGGSSGHAFVLVSPGPEWIEHKWRQATLRAVISVFKPYPWEDDELSLAFAKPIRSRKTGEQIGADWWSVLDRSTWAAARLVFDGSPVVEGHGLEVLPPAVEVREGPPLDLSKIKDLSGAEVSAIEDAIKAIRGTAPQIKIQRANRDGRNVVSGVSITVADLLWTTEIETSNGWRTVRELHNLGVTHVRCQSPFRDSDSWAAFYGIHEDGMPLIYDCGTGEKHVLNRQKLKDMWEQIREWLDEEVQPIFRYSDGSVFSSSLGRKVGRRDVHLDPSVLPRLRTCKNTPMTKSGAVNENLLPTEFSKWIAAAWSDMCKSLPDEEDAKMDLNANQLLKQELGRLLLAQVSVDEGGRWIRRALGTWCHYYAIQTPGKWVRVGSRPAWGRVLDDGKFQIAITHQTADDVLRGTKSDLLGMTQNKLTGLCRRYGLSEDADNRIYWENGFKLARARVVVLTVEFVQSVDLSMDHESSAEKTARDYAARHNSPAPPIGGSGSGGAH